MNCLGCRKHLVTGFMLVLLGAAVPAVSQPCSEDYLVEQGFPTAGPEETRWRICWQPQHQFGLVITGAWFKKAPSADWVRILWDARVGEIFVPYHGDENRFYDVQGFNWDWVKLQPADCPAASGGALLGPGPDACKIVGQRGLAWKYYNQRRMGEQVTLWGAIAAANYNYLVQWTFRDDGMVVGRVGATGPNFPSHPSVNHMHSATWRLDVDLDGWPGDSVRLFTHTETGLTASDTMPVFNKEAGVPWKAVHFNSLLVGDAALENARGSKSYLNLIPLRYGTPRHDEAFTQQDLWVTRYHWSEIYSRYLPNFISDSEDVNGKDVVVWYTGPVHHLVRDEDRTSGNGWMALAMWAEFQLRPHNLFDNTPLHP